MCARACRVSVRLVCVGDLGVVVLGVCGGEEEGGRGEGGARGGEEEEEEGVGRRAAFFYNLPEQRERSANN